MAEPEGWANSASTPVADVARFYESEGDHNPFRQAFLNEWTASPNWATELDTAAQANNWTHLGQPQRWGRRYGHDAHTVRVYWDKTTEKVVRASLTRLGYTVAMITDNTAAEHALKWLRTVTED